MSALEMLLCWRQLRRDLVPPTGSELMCCTDSVDLRNNVVLSFLDISYILLLFMHHVCKFTLMMCVSEIIDLNQDAPKMSTRLI